MWASEGHFWRLFVHLGRRRAGLKTSGGCKAPRSGTFEVFLVCSPPIDGYLWLSGVMPVSEGHTRMGRGEGARQNSIKKVLHEIIESC